MSYGLHKEIMWAMSGTGDNFQCVDASYARELVALLVEAEATLRHARTFIACREKMHPEGVKLYDELLTRLATYQKTQE